MLNSHNRVPVPLPLVIQIRLPRAPFHLFVTHHGRKLFSLGMSRARSIREEVDDNQLPLKCHPLRLRLSQHQSYIPTLPPRKASDLPWLPVDEGSKVPCGPQGSTPPSYPQHHPLTLPKANYSSYVHATKIQTFSECKEWAASSFTTFSL